MDIKTAKAIVEAAMLPTRVAVEGVIPIDYEHRIWGRMQTQVTVDPKPALLKALLRKAKDHQLRGIAANGHVYVLPAYDATHVAIRETLELPTGFGAWGDFFIIKDGDDPLSDDWYQSDDNPVRNGMALLGHPNSLNNPEMAVILQWFQSKAA